MPTKEQISASVIEAARRGDGASRALIYRVHARFVANVAARALGSRGAAMDVTQDTFIHAFEGLHRLKDPGALRGWLAQIAIHQIRRRIRRDQLLRMVGVAKAPPSPLEGWPERLTVAEATLTLREIDRALSTIRPDARLAWLLRHVEGERLEDVAVALDCSLATAKRLIAQASERIAQLNQESP